MRTKASGLELPPYERPQIWEPETIGIWRRYAKLHTQLNPYMRGADATYRRTGMPIMRHGLLLAYPGDPRAAGLDGPVHARPVAAGAPVLEPGRDRALALPAARAVARVLAGAVGSRRRDGAYRMRAPAPARAAGAQHDGAARRCDRLPMMIRAGAMIPLLPADVDTLAPTAAAAGSSTSATAPGGCACSPSRAGAAPRA